MSDGVTGLNLSVVELLKTTSDGEPATYATMGSDGGMHRYSITIEETLPEIVEAIENDQVLVDQLERTKTTD